MFIIPFTPVSSLFNSYTLLLLSPEVLQLFRFVIMGNGSLYDTGMYSRVTFITKQDESYFLSSCVFEGRIQLYPVLRSGRVVHTRRVKKVLAMPHVQRPSIQPTV